MADMYHEDGPPTDDVPQSGEEVDLMYISDQVASEDDILSDAEEQGEEGEEWYEDLRTHEASRWSQSEEEEDGPGDLPTERNTKDARHHEDDLYVSATQSQQHAWNADEPETDTLRTQAPQF